MTEQNSDLARDDAYTRARADALSHWQARVLPFIQKSLLAGTAVIFLTVIAIGFAAYSLIAENGGEAQRMFVERVDATLSEETFDAERSTFAVTAYNDVRLADMARAMQVTRDGLRLAGFMVAICLIFVGSLFVIGKFTESGSIQTSQQIGREFQLSLAATSPGLLSILLGAAIAVTAMVVRPEISYQPATINAADLRMRAEEISRRLNEESDEGLPESGENDTPNPLTEPWQ